MQNLKVEMDFHNDAFAILQLATKLDNWTIELYSRDMQIQEDFKTKKYESISGAEVK